MDVLADSAAEAVGPYLKIGDRIISVDGIRIASKREFVKLAAGEKGTSKRLQVSRVRGRADGLGGGEGCDRRIVFMMSIVLGVPGSHTVFGHVRDGDNLV